MRIATALVTALLYSIPLFGPSASHAASPVGWNGKGCFSNKAPGVSNTVCDYGVAQPFLLKGYSKGGSSTLYYAVQCSKRTYGPFSKTLIDRRVWYTRSFKVTGNFKVYGARATLPATRHCVSANGESPVLTATLKMTGKTTKTRLSITLDSNLPWEN